MFPIVVLFGFLGACVKGVTGFGQAIVVLTLWSLLNACGADVGSLKQLLMCDSFSSLPTAIPFMVLTNVCQNGKIGLTLPIAIVMNLMSPLGAWLVANLEVHILLVCLAITLVTVVTLLNLVPLIMLSSKSAQHKQTQDQEIPLLNDVELPSTCKSDSSLDSRSDLENEIDISENIINNSKNSEQELHVLKAIHLLEDGKNSEFVIQDTPINNESCFGKQIQSLQNIYQSTKQTLNFCCKIFFHVTIQNTTFQRDLNEDSVNLNFQFKKGEQSQQVICCTHNFSERLVITATAGWLNGLKYIFLCSIIAGLMGSMFAIPDPPLIIMTQILDISKQNIRATQSSLGLLNPRPLFYIMFGLFNMQDMHVYLMYSVGTMMGLLLGSLVSSKVSQVWFMRMLTLLVFLSAVTLIWQAFYIAPNNT